MQKKYRLTNNSSFRYVFKNGKRSHGEYLILYTVKAASKKVGVSVSKKVGNSVVRSRVKRLIKEAFRLILEGIGEYNFVVVAKERSREANFHQIRENIIKLLQNQGIIGDKANESHL